jgi:hypothetical protein
MPRSVRRGTRAASLVIGLATMAGACAGPSLPALADPLEIIEAGLASTEAARTVHLEVVVGGEISIAIPGGTGPGTTIKLGGTSASADIDMAGGKGRATFAAPGLLILSGEAIQIGETSYIRTSLGGPLFDAVATTDGLPVNPTDPSSIFDDIRVLLRADGVDPVRDDDVDCAGKSCYAVTIDLTADDLAALGDAVPLLDDLPALPLDLDGATLTVTVRVEKDTYRMAGIGVVLSIGEMGSVTADVQASDWDKPMDISPPPADQIKPAT